MGFLCGMRSHLVDVSVINRVVFKSPLGSEVKGTSILSSLSRLFFAFFDIFRGRIITISKNEQWSRRNNYSQKIMLYKKCNYISRSLISDGRQCDGFPPCRRLL